MKRWLMFSIGGLSLVGVMSLGMADEEKESRGEKPVVKPREEVRKGEQDKPREGAAERKKEGDSEKAREEKKRDLEVHAKRPLPSAEKFERDRKSTRLNSSHIPLSRMPSSA